MLLATIDRVLQNRFNVVLEPDPKRALTLLESPHTFAAIISDLRMPGVSGLGLLQSARRVAPHTPRILISGGAELADTVSAVNDCQVFRILIKPFPAQSLLDAIVAAVEQYRLGMSERVLLEETLQGSVQALAELFLLVQPAAFGRAMRLRRHVSDLARYLGVARKWDIEIAALLSQIGSVTLSAETLDRWYHGRALTEAEAAEVKFLPTTALSVVANIPRLESVKEILRLQDEPASGVELPPGARMLAIARDFDELIARGETAEHALSIMEGRDGRYDSEYLQAFRQLRSDTAPSAEIREIMLSDVRTSMVLASDVHSPTGLLLIARGQRVTPALLQRVRSQWSGFASACPVRVILGH